MTFWSSQTLHQRLAELAEPAVPALIDCNAIQLRVGAEVYVTPSVSESKERTKRLLAQNEPFLVPAGQFAFLLTEEILKVPVDAMAFISMKATFKLKGLVNVSGFHVDPGWHGPLVFAVFNAGPQPIHLHRGLPLFLIWYADLDAPSEDHKKHSASLVISPGIISNLTGGSDSFVDLSAHLKEEVKRLEGDTKALKEHVHELGRIHTRTVTVCVGLASVLATLIALLIGPAVSAWGRLVMQSVKGSEPVIAAQPTNPTQPNPLGKSLPIR
ncbi:dCTP deaminase domain-containing protein [Variovorax boronicumulans]|uniref:dCTP deaminase domain-containing protein n=1 Tax=Variovorax boronicumulans TaxID=436515 RepID=UPI00339B0218